MASAVLPFWPKAAAMAYVTNPNPQNVYSQAFPTNGFTEVVIELVVDAEIGANNTITVYPQISNNGINWDDQTNFTAVSNGGTIPNIQIVKYTDIGSFMRMRIQLDSGAGSLWVGGTLQITGTGRS